jgi:hypothetical protein
MAKKRGRKSKSRGRKSKSRSRSRSSHRKGKGTVGSKAKVYNGTAQMDRYGHTKSEFMRNANGKIVLKTRSLAGKRNFKKSAKIRAALAKGQRKLGTTKKGRGKKKSKKSRSRSASEDWD